MFSSLSQLLFFSFAFQFSNSFCPPVFLLASISSTLNAQIIRAKVLFGSFFYFGLCTKKHSHKTLIKLTPCLCLSFTPSPSVCLTHTISFLTLTKHYLSLSFSFLIIFSSFSITLYIFYISYSFFFFFIIIS